MTTPVKADRKESTHSNRISVARLPSCHSHMEIIVKSNPSSGIFREVKTCMYHLQSVKSVCNDTRIDVMLRNM